MFENGQLRALEQRRLALIRESDKHRAILLAEAPRFRSVASWVDVGIDVAQKARAGWAAVSPWISPPGLTSPLAQAGGIVSKIRYGVSIARSLLGFWRSRRTPAKRGEAE